MFQTYDLEAVAIGSVTDDGQYRVFHGGKIVADVPVDALAEEAPVYQKAYQEPERMRAFKKLAPFIPEITNSTELLKRLLQQPTIASKNQFTKPMIVKYKRIQWCNQEVMQLF